MTKRWFALFLALSLLLCGCVYRSSMDEQSYISVYRLRSGGDGGAALVKEMVAYSPEKAPEDAMLAALNSKPGSTGLSRVFPEGVRARSCSIEKGLATVDMSDGFARLDEIRRLLCAGALVLTLSTLDEVCAVNVECGGEILAEGLRPEDIQFADAVFEEHERSAKIFLPNEDGEGLTPRSHTIKMSAEASIEELIAQAVLDALPVYTERTVVLSAQTQDGICSLDLSEAFYGNEPADSIEGMLMVYALVNSLCRLNNVDGLVITVEGQNVVSYGGYRASWPLSARDSLIIY